jgi:hypothetical protein
LPYKWRNKGYVWNKRIGKKGKEYDNQDFKDLKGIIEEAINDSSSLVEFDAKQVLESEFKKEKFQNLERKSTFLDVLSLQDYEQAYTNMLYAVLRVGNGNMLKTFFAFMKEKGKLTEKQWGSIDSQWKKIEVHKEWPSKERKGDAEEGENSQADSGEKNGRMDVCADIFDERRRNLIQRVIIENKIDSGLNGRDKGMKISQLNTYYKWGQGAGLDENKRPRHKKPLCIVIAPKYRIEELKWDIKSIDKMNQSHTNWMSPKYLILDYGFVADFIDANREKIEKEIDPRFVEQFSKSFREHSLEERDDYAWRFFLETQKAVNHKEIIP